VTQIKRGNDVSSSDDMDSIEKALSDLSQKLDI